MNKQEQLVFEKNSLLEKELAAKNRELEIEASLERVREKAMAMRSSEELNVLIATVFAELTHLDLVLTRCVIMIYDTLRNGFHWWMANSETPSAPMNYFVKDTNLPFFNAYLKGWQERTMKWTFELEGENKIRVDDFLFTKTELSLLPDFVISGMRAPEKVFLNASFNNFGNLTLASLEPLTDEQFKIMLRFAKVFDLTYTRFNDLKNAEVQAREAHIEAALERVRSQTMAMHKSSELLDVIKLLGDQFQLLGFKIHSANFNTSYRQKDWNLWLYNPGNPVYPEQVHIPYFDHPFFNRTLESIASGSNFHTVVFTKEEKNGFLDHLYAHTIARNSSEERKKFTYDAPGFAWSTVYLKNTALTIANYDAEPYTEEQNEIIRRFGSSFEQAYTRFLDLQKAEAQAREAEIQLALERVRAKTMAMQKPSEFVDVINIIGEQFMHLGFDFDWVNFSANGVDVSKAIDIYNFHVIPGLYQGATRLVIPFFEHPVFTKAEESVNEYYTKGNSFTVVMLDKKDKDTFLNHLFTNTIYKDLPEEVKTSQYNREVYQTSNVVLKDTWLSVGKYDATPLTDEQIGILKRLANEFGQAYTRFLDLQKAEEQAREARIEAALESVRASSMAMHHSDELENVVKTLAEKLVDLGISLDGALIFFFDKENRAYNLWIATNQLPAPLKVNYPYEEAMQANPIIQDLWKAIETGADFLNKSYAGNVKNDYFRFTAKHNANIPEEVKKMQQEAQNWTFSFTGGKHSVIGIDSWHGKVITADEFLVLKRFATVFEQAYTRFLDLQKAEAQAREAQIEAALEKVRSRSLAMHKSDELREVIVVVFEKLKELGLVFENAGIQLFVEKSKDILQWVAAPNLLSKPILVNLPYEEKELNASEIVRDIWLAKEKNKNIFNKSYSLIEKNKFFKYAGRHNSFEIPQQVRDIQLQAPGYTYNLVAEKHAAVWVDTYSFQNISVEDFNVLKRVAKVFEQAYTRFLDLQKAEAQAREAQIQLALERVRARTMAMYKSEELTETAALLFQQIQSLGLPLISCGYNIWEENDKVCDAYMSDAGGFIHSPFKIPLTQSPVFIHFYNSRQKKEKFYTEQLNGEVLASHYKYMLTLPGFASIADNFLKAGFRLPEFQVNNVANFSRGNLIFITSKEVPEAEDIFMRFASVFDQSYTRFLDLQKAEAQAREAHIEAALEKVRSRTMAMRKSDELSEVAILLFNQVKSLGIKTWTTGFNVWSDNNNYYTDYITSPQGGFIEPYTIDATHFAAFAEISHARKTGEEFFVSYLEGDILKQTYLELAKFGDRRQYEIMLEGGFEFPSRQFNHFVFGSKVSLMFITYEPVPEAHDIFKRFGKVFEQTYTRFLDLQKAEAQAREAQIEAALERVRAKAMAMHHSNDVSVAASMVFSELRKLGINPIRCGVGLLNKESRKAQLYSATSSSDGDSLSLVGWVMLAGHPVLENIYDTWLKKEDYYPELTGSQLKSYYENLLAGLSLPVVPNWETGEKQYGHFFSFSVGCLYTWSERHYNEPEIKILKRFAAIIDLTFRRYLDLQKAEANAKEAQIEASLERVRGKAMAMHTSQDLSDTIGVFYQELKSFSLTPMRCGVGLLDKEERIGDLFTWNTTDKGKSFELVGRLKMEGHPVLNKVYEGWLTQTEYHPVLRGDEIKEYNKILKPQMAFPDHKHDDVQFGYFFFFPEGGVYAWTEKEMHEDELQIYRRFTSVLSLTYKRYRDIEKAEASAKEAVKQSALDRIRAEIASMRTISDLDRITPLIWNELTILGVPFIRCGVFIMDDDQQQIHTFLSTPEGKGIAAFHLPYNTPGNIAHVITHWQKKEIYTDRWDEEAFKEFADNLVQQGAMKSSEQYLSTMPAGGFNLHFVPFQQGMLYVGNVAPLGEEEINLLQSIADAFSTAYARYEDFNKLEAAKKQVDNTLTELKQAQQQLVQSEKMASLGELTAGIAHEIQNPLNFVNNFSEVNKEMLEELKTERLKPDEERDDDLQNDLINDVIENSEKILHHGKRADAIVKGMLQHSRQSSGQKEPTDIHALADEYLRLSYHGMRAKDKSFNAEMKTDFDESLEKINIIPQDIGRVLLNLFNNAFYAVTEKKKQLVNEEKSGTSNLYQPTVSVSTRKSENSVFITVSDNGNGIPKNIIDKIFQPFFTTKPTGSGTGLGLSLSYDIVKAHGGKIKVDSIEQVGTEFIVELPI